MIYYYEIVFKRYKFPIKVEKRSKFKLDIDNKLTQINILMFLTQKLAV